MLFDQQECLMIYLEYLLLNWAPEMDVSVDPSTGDRGKLKLLIFMLLFSLIHENKQMYPLLFQ